MKHILLSIKPKWAEAILDGRKIWEYRKKPPGIAPPYKVILYATSPVQKVVGEAIVKKEIRDNVNNVIYMTQYLTPHTKQDIRDYFGDRREACALKMTEVERYEEPFELDIHPPMNFQYVEPGEIAP